MTQDSLGIAVIGVGMVGRAHAAGYRTAGSLFDITGRPDTRLVAIADAYEPFADRCGEAVRLRTLRDLVAGNRGRARHRRRQCRRRQLDAP